MVETETETGFRITIFDMADGRNTYSNNYVAVLKQLMDKFLSTALSNINTQSNQGLIIQTHDITRNKKSTNNSIHEQRNSFQRAIYSSTAILKRARKLKL